MNWVLVIYIYAGILANGDSVAITSIPGFNNRQECVQAGRDAEGLTSGSSKVYRFVCLKKVT